MQRNEVVIDFDLPDYNLSKHKEFYNSDFDPKSKIWVCRHCGLKYPSNIFPKHLESIGLSVLTYYYTYIDKPKCCVVECNNLCNLPKLSRLLKSCSDHANLVKSSFQSKNMKNLNLDWWKDHEYRDKMISMLSLNYFSSDSVRNRNKRNWQDPQYRRNMIDKLREANSTPEGLLRNARNIRKGTINNPSKYAGKYKEKWLYCFDLGNGYIKLGSTGSKDRLKFFDDNFRKLFSIKSESLEIMKLEDYLLNETEEFFDNVNSGIINDGKAEIRKIDALDVIYNKLNELGYKV